MNSLKSIAKGGWHPDKSSSSSSASSSHRSGDNERFKNFKGLQQVANWTGHGTKGGSQDPSTVTSRPLTSLKDPYSFGAPPKRDPKAPLPPPIQGPVLSCESELAAPQPPTKEEEAHQPRSFKVNTTGLSTSGLPEPPKRAFGTASGLPLPLLSRPTPPLPNRSQPPPLPGRQPSNSVGTQDNPPRLPSTVTGLGAASSTLSASGRLGRAGVSVPGLGIGVESPSLPLRSVPTPPSRGASRIPTTSIGEPSGWFAGPKSSSASSSVDSPAEASAGGTTWAQKQAALTTISQARKDPTSISFSDATAVAKTAGNFHQRHGDQVAKGYRQLETAGLVDNSVRNKLAEHGTLNDGPQPKWGDSASRISKASSKHSLDVPSTTQGGTGSLELVSAAGKKKPPPPPSKPKALGNPNSPPPPIPLSTKPK
ncbi:hypothetical protein TWF106_001177 [Orbilia oligospora]|uniref:Uncharacterized protein n=1 Tax=Orbilia oligospora TaxID=2813651 RepID=A0A6G1M497_ORBOL|nr:hypothetical protein TWF788_000700 [Orbilia oligospora]KAF3202485.1 hypothetical protein TWF191_002935 [Orbilia oligospora]KAF3205254.1 hypothetical protein TWF106_001177 [Orbilia oligospora]KAF3245077.1 hypothetical protein TWF192_007597 [Orbilia oligospora]